VSLKEILSVFVALKSV